MSRSIKAIKNYSQNEKGEIFWSYHSTQFSIKMDAISKILFEESIECQQRIVKLETIKENILYYQDSLYCFTKEISVEITDNILQLIEKAKEEGIEYILFEIY